MIYPVILAGGSGTRLWPLSKKECPKQLMSFLGRSTLLDQTLERLSSFMPEKYGIIVTQDQYAEKIRSHVKERIAQVLAEPVGKNTAPAIAFVLAHLLREKVDEESVLLIMPADHFIPDKNYLEERLRTAAEHAVQEKRLVLLGIKPSYPATGYGYITQENQQDNNNNNNNENTDNLLRVKAFHEKPSYAVAQQYCSQNNIFWNSGIVVATIKTLVQEFLLHQAELFSRITQSLDNKMLYEQIEALSFDYAILEKSKNSLLLPYEKTWHDVGNLETLMTLENEYNNQQHNQIHVESSGNLALRKNCPAKTIIFIGVNNLRIIETDDLLIICAQDKLQNIKESARCFQEPLGESIP